MRLALLALVLLAAPALAKPPRAAPPPPAAAPWDRGPFAASPADLARAAAALPTPGDAEVEMLFRELHLAFDAQGRETATYRSVYRVLSPDAARAWGMMETSYAPWYEEVPEVRARVVSPDGSVHQLDPRTLVDSGSERDGAHDVVSDARILKGPLPGVGVGSVVELELVQRSKDSLFNAGTSGRATLDYQGMALRRGRLVLEAPRGLPLRAALHGSATPLVREERDGRVRLTWEAAPVPARPEAPPFAPAEAEGGIALDYSTGKDWQALARRYHEVVEAQLAGASLAREAAEAVGDAGSDRRLAAARAMAWVHARVRYSGLHTGAAAVVPRTPGETLARGFGDCKDLATLVVALLRARGVPAHVALLRVQDVDVAEGFPGLGRFDHAIVHVPGSPALWVDATDPHTRVGELNLAVQGRLALVAAPATRALQRLPEAPASANALRVTRTVLLAEDGPARVREATEVTGSVASSYRAYFGSTPADEQRKGMESYAKSSLREAKLEGAHAVRGLESPEQPLRLELEVSGTKLADTDGTRALVRLSPYPAVTRMPDFLLEEERADPKAEDARPARTADVLLPEPHVYELTYRVVPPEGYRAQELPEARTLTLGPASLSWRFERAGDEVTARVRFDAGKRRYSAAEAEAFRTAVVAMGKETAPWLTLERDTVALVAAGRVREALGRLRAAAERHPTEAVHRLHLAEQLLALGMGEDARAEARRAVALEPKLARAHLTLARALTADALGRAYKPGFDAKGAEAALRRARALAPDDAEARLQLARLLARGTDGTPRGPGARTAEALAEYRALAKDLKTDAHDAELLQLLWDAELLSEYLTQAAAKGTQARLRTPEALAARAAVDGPPAAVRAAAQLLPDTGERRQALAAAATRLLSLRRYPEGVALLQEAARGDAPAQLLGQLALFRKVRRLELAELKGDDPRDAVRRLSLAAAEPATVQTRQLLARALLAQEPDAERNFLTGLGSATRALKRRASGMSLRALTEVGLAVGDLQVEGDRTTGARVRIIVPGAQGAQATYLVWEDGGWRVRAVSQTLAHVGAEALARAEAGDLAAARLWLDWARDELPAHLAEDRPMAHFAQLWTRGAAPAPLERVRLAAASLAAFGAEGPRVVKVLEAARAAETDADARRLLDRDLTAAHATGKRWAEAERAAARVLESRPEDVFAFEARTGALLKLERHADATRVAEARLARLPDDVVARTALAAAAQARGDYPEHQRQLRQVVASGKAQSGHYNNLAWYALFHAEGASEQAQQEAQHAATMTSWSDSAVLNTVAAVYANAGRAGEAHNLLLKYLAEDEDREVGPSDWYVHARVAEDYGLLDTARAAYARVKPKERDLSSTDVLARARLAVLDGARRPATAAPAAP